MDEDPPVGEVFFYLAEYLEGTRSGYGTVAGGREVVIVSGDPCH